MIDSAPALAPQAPRMAWWPLPCGSHAALALGLTLAFVWLGATAWIRPLTLPDEGRYVGVALEMLLSGNWATPTLAGLPFLHKPPLFYWLTAAALSAFGVTEWAARAASLLGALAGSAAIVMLALQWNSQRVAKLTLLVLATLPLWFIGAQFANMDMLVAGCISATIALFAHSALRRELAQPWRRSLLAAYAAAGLGVLAKGLIGAVIPALVLFTWLAIQKRWRSAAALLWLPGIGLFALVAMPWFVHMQMAFPDFLHYFIVVQHFERFAQGGFNNAEPSWFYLVVMPTLSLPWLAWLAASMNRAYWQRVARTPLLLLMWLWLGVVIGFFSLPQSKLLGYVLPAVPPLAFLIADAASSAERPRLIRATAVLAAALCLGLVFAVTVFQPRTNRELARTFASQRRPQEALVFLNEYFYDVGFYSRNATSPLVVDDWHNPEVRNHDNWRKELADASTFAPQAATERLIDEAALVDRLCHGRVTWVMARESAGRSHSFLAASEKLARNRDDALWRVDPAAPEVARSLACHRDNTRR